MSLRRARRALRARGVAGRIPPPPPLPLGATRGVLAVLRRTEPTCLERATVLQTWLSAHQQPVDIVVGVAAEQRRCHGARLDRTGYARGRGHRVPGDPPHSTAGARLIRHPAAAVNGGPLITSAVRSRGCRSPGVSAVLGADHEVRAGAAVRTAAPARTSWSAPSTADTPGLRQPRDLTALAMSGSPLRCGRVPNQPSTGGGMR